MIWLPKMIAKAGLARIPMGYWSRRKLGAFRHGHMHKADYAVRVVTAHIERLGGAEAIGGSVCLELGPGDSLASALIANAFGAKSTLLVDAGDFANRDMNIYRDIAASMRAAGLEPIDLEDIDTTDQMLSALDSHYLTDGLRSLKAVDADSVSAIWSQAVLEHVRIDEVAPTFQEFYRILKPGGGMSHRVDFKDHLDASLNNMRFSRSFWESNFVANSGFYTNRIRYSEMVDMLKKAGFEVSTLKIDRWEALPLPRTSLAREFRHLSDDDLLISGCNLVAKR